MIEEVIEFKEAYDAAALTAEKILALFYKLKNENIVDEHQGRDMTNVIFIESIGIVLSKIIIEEEEKRGIKRFCRNEQNIKNQISALLYDNYFKDITDITDI
jgi:hypothetical protein